jgi:hypothetical protein
MMGQGEGLLRARGQIAFILALAASLVVIVYLETVSSALHATRNAAPPPGHGELFASAAQDLLAQAEQQSAADPADAGMARTILAILAAEASGVLDSGEAAQRLRQLLSGLDAVERDGNLQPSLLLAAIRFPELAVELRDLVIRTAD